MAKTNIKRKDFSCTFFVGHAAKTEPEGKASVRDALFPTESGRTKREIFSVLFGIIAGTKIANDVVIPAAENVIELMKNGESMLNIFYLL